MNVAELRIPKELRLELTCLDGFSVLSGQPRLRRAGRNGCSTGRLDAILYRGEYTTSYRFVNEFILAAESMSCGDRRGSREGGKEIVVAGRVEGSGAMRLQPERGQRSKNVKKRRGKR